MRPESTSRGARGPGQRQLSLGGALSVKHREGVKRDRLPTPVFLGFPGGSSGKDSTCNAGDLGSVPGLGRSPGGGKGYPLQYSGLENPMDCEVTS